MITLTKVRQLDLSATTSGRPLHLSAASGLVCLNSFNYVVADDELHLGVFRANSSEPGHLIRLFEGELPACKADRKKQKADFEALTLLPTVASQRAVSPAYNQSTFVDKPCAPWEHPDDAEPPSLGQADPGGPAARYRMLKQAAKGRT